MRRTLSALLLASASMLANAYSVSFDTTVDGKDNLYYTNWGHWYTTADDNALGNLDSNPAHAVALSGLSFNFADFDTLSIDASGSVVDHFSTATGPDGDSGDSCLFNDCYFRDPKAPAERTLRAYSLIGIWSSSATSIVPLQDWTQAVMFIGSHIDLKVPDLSSVYLFLAENDGGFGDNSGYYDVHLAASTSDDAQLSASVPEPGSMGLLMAGIAGLVITRRRMK